MPDVVLLKQLEFRRLDSVLILHRFDLLLLILE